MKPSYLILSAAILVATSARADSPVPYPDGYRNWKHVKSMAIQPGHALYGSFGGIHHLYANQKALAGYKSGTFPDGSVIIFDLLETQDADNAITEGKRKVVGVMHKDRRKFTATGGWGFEGFAGDSRTERAVGANAKTACFDCHAPLKETDHVFSKMRD